VTEESERQAQQSGGLPETAGNRNEATGSPQRPVAAAEADSICTGGVVGKNPPGALGGKPHLPDQSLEDAHDAKQPAGASVAKHTGEPLRQELQEIQKMVDAGIGRVLQEFKDKLKYDESKQCQVDQLHQELQEHRAGLVTQAIRPFIRGMIRLHDDMGNLLSGLREKPVEELSPEKFFNLLEGLQEDVVLLLENNGIVAYREPGGVGRTFNPVRQRALKKRVPSSDETLKGTVAESIGPGFAQGPRILQKERVTVYAYVPGEPGPSGTTGSVATDGGTAGTQEQRWVQAQKED